MESRIIILWIVWITWFTGGFYHFDKQRPIELILGSPDGLQQLVVWLLVSTTLLTMAIYSTYKKVTAAK